MHKDTARRFEDTVQLLYSFFEPSYVVVYTARKSVLEAPYFALVAPYYFVSTVTEKRRVYIHQIYTFAVDVFEDFEAVA
jgi:hypothetical protein